MSHWGRWRIGLSLVLLATAVRVCWTLLVPTIAVGDFATYRESAIYLAEFGQLDPGFVYMPGLVVMLAALHRLGGDVLAAKMLGVAFGGLAVGPVYVVAARLGDGWRRDVGAGGSRLRQGTTTTTTEAPIAGSWRGDAGAVVAGLGYALWPAGIALSSVIGTDIPTAAVIMLALSLLCVWGDTRPLLASVMFGAGMGIAAYFRAVALPLTVLSAAYWLARRANARAVITRTAIAVIVTALLLVPWGLRNRSRNGEFYLTDSHGGITALMGNDPNTEGTYSRSLSTMFRELTGRTFLTEPHRQTDHAAYGLAKQFMAFDPAWTAGMIALRIERLFAPERGLLYWPIYRVGVLPGAAADWFNQHRAGITALADWFYVLFVLGLCAGLSFAAVERRWMVLVPLPFALAMAATYALFVAEPRYRVTTEVVLFPLAGFGAWRLGTSGFHEGAALWRRMTDHWRVPPAPQQVPSPWVGTRVVDARRGLMTTLVVLLVLAAVVVLVARGGEALRVRHRWAATVWRIDGRPQLVLWRRGGLDAAVASPVRGAAPGAVLRLLPGQRQVDAQIVVPNLVANFPPKLDGVNADHHLGASLVWSGLPSPGTRVSIGGVTAGVGATRLFGSIATPEGPARMEARLERLSPDDGLVEVSISEVVLTTKAPP